MKQAKSSGRQTEPDNVDGAAGEDIPEQFANVYKELFNSADDKVGLEKLKQRLEEAEVKPEDVNCITPDVIKAAVAKLKSGKIDISGNFSSEALLNTSNELFVIISELFKGFLIDNDFSCGQIFYQMFA